ncbi:MAG: hypothetical protein Q7S65_03510 [Nanoarchaeota archaeon]|nr:hypothetical protein [Nanoarchaeota archaeon]
MAGGGDTLRQIEEARIKYNDVFHFKNLYNMVHEYLIDEMWYGRDGPQDYPTSSHRDIETFYMERTMQKALHKGGKQYWIWWRLYKKPLYRYSGYFEYKLEIEFHGEYIQSVDIMHQGKKIKADKGELEIHLKGKIIRTDLGNKWKDHWLLKHFQDVYEKRILSQDLDKAEKDLWREMYRLQGVIKSYLNLRNFIPVPEPFHPAQYGMEEIQ